jgi:hypothetical protein
MAFNVAPFTVDAGQTPTFFSAFQNSITLGQVKFTLRTCFPMTANIFSVQPHITISGCIYFSQQGIHTCESFSSNENSTRYQVKSCLFAFGLYASLAKFHHSYLVNRAHFAYESWALSFFVASYISSILPIERVC